MVVNQGSNSKIDHFEFAKRIKMKYPQYIEISDLDLTERMINKYPQYKDTVVLPERERAAEILSGITRSGVGFIPKAIGGVAKFLGNLGAAPGSGIESKSVKEFGEKSIEAGKKAEGFIRKGYSDLGVQQNTAFSKGGKFVTDIAQSVVGGPAGPAFPGLKAGIKPLAKYVAGRGAIGAGEEMKYNLGTEGTVLSEKRPNDLMIGVGAEVIAPALPSLAKGAIKTAGNIPSLIKGGKSGVVEKITRDLPASRIEKELGLTPTERGVVERTGETAGNYMLRKNIAGLDKPNQINELQKIADDGYNGLTEVLKPIKETSGSENVSKMLDTMTEEMTGSPILLREYAPYIQKLEELKLQKGYSVSEKLAIKRDFDRIIGNKLFNAKGRVTGIEEKAIANWRNGLMKEIEDIANNVGIDVKAYNTDVRNSTTIRDGLLRRLSQENKNNTFGLQDIGIGAILGQGDPFVSAGVIIAKKGTEKMMPSISQKLYNLSDKPNVTKNLNRGVAITPRDVTDGFSIAPRVDDSVTSPRISGALPAPRATEVAPGGLPRVQQPVSPTNKITKRQVIETGSENIKKPIDTTKVQADNARKELVSKTQSEKQKKIDDFNNIDSPEITNKNEMKPGMQVKVTGGDGSIDYGTIAKIGPTGKIYIEGKPYTGYLSAVAKDTTPQVKPGKVTKKEPRDEFVGDKRDITPQRKESERMIEDILAQKSTRNYEIKNILESLGVDDIKKLTDQQIEDIRTVVLKRTKNDEYWNATGRLLEKSDLGKTFTPKGLETPKPGPKQGVKNAIKTIGAGQSATSIPGKPKTKQITKETSQKIVEKPGKVVTDSKGISKNKAIELTNKKPKGIIKNDLPGKTKMETKTKSLESADLATSIKKAKAEGKTFDEFVDSVQKQELKVKNMNLGFDKLLKQGKGRSKERDLLEEEISKEIVKLEEMRGGKIYKDLELKEKIKTGKEPAGYSKNYSSPNDIPIDVYEYATKQNIFTADANDAHRWSRIIDTLDNPRYKEGEKVKLYRALEKNLGDEIRPGDWVTTYKEYAEQHASKYLKDGKVIELEVDGIDVLRSPSGNIEEAIYAPVHYSKPIKKLKGAKVGGTQSNLRKIREEANKPSLGKAKATVSKTSDLATEARKTELPKKVDNLTPSDFVGNRDINEIIKDTKYQDMKTQAEKLKQKFTVSNNRDDLLAWRKLRNQLTEIDDLGYKNRNVKLQKALEESDLDLIKKDSSVDNLGKNDLDFLTKEAKQYKSFDEFKGMVRGSSTQYGAYRPDFRKYVSPTSKSLGDVKGLDPEATITVYRGLDVKSVGGKGIKKGDFVTTDYDDALGYTDSPSKIVSKEVKLKDLITEYPDEVDIKDPLNPVSYELIYNDKSDFVKVTDTKLRKIREEANK